jgi:hypothetical protein
VRGRMIILTTRDVGDTQSSGQLKSGSPLQIASLALIGPASFSDPTAPRPANGAPSRYIFRLKPCGTGGFQPAHRFKRLDLPTCNQPLIDRT